MELKTIRCYSHLTLEDRWLIEQFDQAKMPVSEIARRLGKHRSTVYREMKRNRFQDEVWHDLDGYFCVVAHSIAQDRRERTAKLSRLPSFGSLWLIVSPAVGRPSKLRDDYALRASNHGSVTKASIALSTRVQVRILNSMTCCLREENTAVHVLADVPINLNFLKKSAFITDLMRYQVDGSLVIGKRS